MADFFEQPILNSPYEYPGRHWELDQSGQPTNKIIEVRRTAEFITPIPKPKKRKKSKDQLEMGFDEEKAIFSATQKYDPNPIINEIRRLVNEWRRIPQSHNWKVTPETLRLLQYWRHHDFQDIRPFFCQVEAVETAIWLAEVLPSLARSSDRWKRTSETIVGHLDGANEEANPGLRRLALKLATGAGKTTVMAMLIAWQTINAVRRPTSRRFTRGFLIVTPGITIRDRLRVLQPNDPDSYYKTRELIPHDMLDDLDRAKIVITNYHAFKLRERVDLSKGARAALEGWREEKMQTLETEGQMLQRVMPELMGMKNILVLNDEAHHCYREKPDHTDEGKLKGDDRKEAEKNNEAARLWISGIEAVQRKLGVPRVFDLSATPFFLRGSGYAEGTLFPWTMSDFSLMDAIECFLRQDYPAEMRELMVLDDADQYDNHQGDGWRVVSLPFRFRTLGEKRNASAGLLSPDIDAYCVWDDDVYLPWHMSAATAALAEADYTIPTVIYNDKRNRVQRKSNQYLFHGAWAFRRDMFERVGGYPFIQSGQDQSLLQRFKAAKLRHADPIQHDPRPSYIYRWFTAHSTHISAMGTNGSGNRRRSGWRRSSRAGTSIGWLWRTPNTRRRQHVFGIGLGRTGTRSLTDAAVYGAVQRGARTFEVGS